MWEKFIGGALSQAVWPGDTLRQLLVFPIWALSCIVCVLPAVPPTTWEVRRLCKISILFSCRESIDESHWRHFVIWECNLALTSHIAKKSFVHRSYGRCWTEERVKKDRREWLVYGNWILELILQLVLLDGRTQLRQWFHWSAGYSPGRSQNLLVSC